jgi:hypothetical protein
MHLSTNDEQLEYYKYLLFFPFNKQMAQIWAKSNEEARDKAF